MKNILIVFTLLLSGCANGPTLCQSRMSELDQAKNEGKVTETDYLKIKLEIDRMCMDKPRSRLGAALKSMGSSLTDDNKLNVYDNNGTKIGSVH